MVLPESCCPPGSFGAMGSSSAASSVTPKGKMVSLKASNNNKTTNKRADMPCYHVGSETPQQVVLVFSDVHGIDSGNHKVFCDLLHEKMGPSTAVWMPDLFRGYPMAPDISNRGNKQFWVDWMCRLSIIWAEKTRITVPGVRADLEEIVQPNLPSTVGKIGMVGFCFGAWVIGKSLAWNNQDDSKFLPGLHAGVLIHPSWRPEGVIVGGGQTKEEMAEATKTKPLLVLPGRNDLDFLASSPIVQQLAKQRDIPMDQLVVEFTTMDHGWVSRADSSQDEAMRQAQEEATQRTADFFLQHIM